MNARKRLEAGTLPRSIRGDGGSVVQISKGFAYGEGCKRATKAPLVGGGLWPVVLAKRISPSDRTWTLTEGPSMLERSRVDRSLKC